MASAIWLERHRTLKDQAEQFIAKARAEVDVSRTGQVADRRKSAQSLAARRKLMQVSKILTEMEQLSQDNLRAEDDQLRVRVQSDLSDLQRRQREALNETKAARSSFQPPSVRAEETAESRQHSDRDLVQLQYDGLAQQDETLDRVERGVARVRTQAETIQGEVTEQTQLIESLDYDVEHVHGRLENVRRRVEGVLTRMNRKLYYFTCFLVPFALVVIVIYCLKHL